MITLLLIVCSTINVSAASTAREQKRPEKVIANLNAIIAHFGHKGGQSFAVNRNPNTGIIESSEKIATFSCKSTDLSFETIAESFMADEPLCYQILHMVPGNTENFNLRVVTNEGSKNVFLRKKSTQEMWLMCVKNPENPQLRDAYAIVWEEGDFMSGNDIEGTVYMITSLRPDIYEKNMSSAGVLGKNKNTFTIDGRVGYDLTDSLYVVYMADTAEELNNVKDSDFVATMPVVNKRFSFSVELDKRKVGRIRTVMPDGSLCHIWTNLDFVPGETYRITTHNGYFDEDRDYERRVGRFSGKSLLNDLQILGDDDQTVEQIDTVPGYQEAPDTMPVVDASDTDKWRLSLTPAQIAQLRMKVEAVETHINLIEKTYENALEGLEASIKRVGGLMAPDGTIVIDANYEQLYNQNKEADRALLNAVKLFKASNIPPKDMLDFYKNILDMYTKQNQSLTKLTLARAAQTKQAKKTQKLVQGLMEKYMKEMSAALEEAAGATDKK